MIAVNLVQGSAALGRRILLPVCFILLLQLLPLQLLPAGGESEQSGQSEQTEQLSPEEIERRQTRQSVEQRALEAPVLAPSGQLEATITVGEQQLYRLRIEQAGFLIIDSAGPLDLFGALFDIDGEQLTGDDDSGEEGNFAFALALMPGEYFLRVEGFDEETSGSYMIRSLFLPDESSDLESARSLRFGRESRAEIGLADEADFFRFEMPADGLLILSASYRVALLGALLDGAGMPIDTIEAFPWQRILSRGTYYIRLQPRFADTRGSYQLMSRFVQARPVVYNRIERQELSLGETQRIFSLPIAERTTLLVELEAEQELTATLTDNAGRTIGRSSGSTSARITRILPADTYYLIVSADDQLDDLDDFQITAYLHSDQSSSRTDARPIPLDSRHSAEIYPRTDIDVFQIEVEQEGFLTVGTESPIPLTMVLRNIDGMTLASSGGQLGGRNANVSQLVVPGIYFINIRASENAWATGSYKLLAEFDGTTSLENDQIQTGRLDRPGARRYYSLEVDQPSDIGLHASGSASPFLQLLDHAGRPIEGSAVPAGRYFICVRGVSEATTGPFELLYSLLNTTVSETLMDEETESQQ